MSSKSRTPSLVHHFLEQLAPLGNVSHRTMFGAECLFINGKAFGIVEDGELFLKVDAETRPRFLEAGGRAFGYETKDGRRMEMSYVTIPGDDLDDQSALLAWGRMAAEVVGRAKKGSAKKGSATTTARSQTRPKRRAPSRRPRK